MATAISEFAARQKTFNERQAKATDELSTAVNGVKGDIENLNKKIEELQNSSGHITKEDQALLDEIETSASALSDKLEATSTALKVLDDATPPAPPSENPAGFSGPVNG